jgi:hypothetical protein
MVLTRIMRGIRIKFKMKITGGTDSMAGIMRGIRIKSKMKMTDGMDLRPSMRGIRIKYIRTDYLIRKEE